MKPFFVIVLALLTMSIQAQQKIYLYKSGNVIDKYLITEVDSIIFYATLPQLTTSQVTDVNNASARTGGSVSSDGGEAVTDRGICYNTTGSPVYTDSRIGSGSGTGNFEVTLSNLAAGQTYYVRAYAVNSVGTAYGNQQVFSTWSSTLPVFNNALNITTGTNSATVQVSGLNDGGGTISAKGLVWSTGNMSPDLQHKDGFTNEGGGSSDFSSTISNLSPNTTYYVRAYATNAVGTGYGAVSSFTTSDNKVVDAEGNAYPIMTYGNQTWMTANLKATRFNNDTPITESWDYDDNPANRSLYGRLYSWEAANDPRGACPAGWHVPTSAEWDELLNYLSEKGYAGKLAKAISSQSGWAASAYDNTPGNQPGTNNASGFSAVPAGMKSSWGYQNKDYITWWWAADDWVDNTAYGNFKTVKFDESHVGTYVEAKSTGFSVRCVKDASDTPPANTKPSVSTSGATNVGPTSAVINGKVLSNGGLNLTQRGFYWSQSNTNPGPNDQTALVEGQTGDYQYLLSGLKENTTYYYKAFATNSMGTATGDAKSFKTTSSGGGGGANTFTDARDGKSYKMITIGTQTWMAENLAYLPQVNATSDYIYDGPAYFVYGYEGNDVNAAKATANYQTYGVLYNWHAAINGEAASNQVPSGVQGVCPAGWHLPGYDEIYILINYTGGHEFAGNKLKVAGTEYWKAPNQDATNSSGFSFLPGGKFSYGQGSGSQGEYGYIWSATEKDAGNAYEFEMSYELPYFWRYANPKIHGNSIRCVKD